MDSQPSKMIRAIAGFLAGLAGGVAFDLLVSPSIGFGVGLVTHAALGVIFGLVFGPRVGTVGAGLVWGEAYGVFWWLVGWLTLIPLFSGRGLSWRIIEVRQALPLLLAQVVVYGIVLGVGYCLLARGLDRLKPGETAQPALQPGRGIPTAHDIVPAPFRAVFIGGFGGLCGSWVFVRGIEAAEFYPLVAGIMDSDSLVLGQVLHYAIGAIIGVSFGLLFHQDVQGAGSGLVWGMNYGLLWWIIGAMTLMPLFLGMKGQPDWSLAAARAAFPSLVAHMLYGALVGLLYASINKLWQVLFVESDPLNRSLEGAGTRGLRSVLMGLAAGIMGGLLFTIVMVGVGALPRVASLIGAESAFAGFIVHLIIAIIVGSSYGLLFQREAYSYGSGLGWGLVYGFLWWVLGAATLFAVLLRQHVDWSVEAVVAIYPSLVGHLLYGAGLGLFFQFLARRYDAELCGRAQLGTQGTRYGQGLRPKRRCSGTPAAALWTVTLVLGVMLPLLLS